MMDDRIYRYIAEHSESESEGLEWIRRQTNLRTNHARMLSGPVQGSLLSLLTQISGARRALEVGTFTGYSSVCIARALPMDGHLDTLELNDELNSLIFEGWKVNGVEERITLHQGPALESLDRIASDPAFIPYDLAFIDANKREYCAYFEKIVPMIRRGGLILADNTLWDGKILENPMPQDAQTVEIARFNELVAGDARVQTVMLPLRDGLTLMRVR